MYRRLCLLELFHKALLELVEELIDLWTLHRIAQQIIKLDQLREKEKVSIIAKPLKRIPAMALGGRVLRGLGSAFRAIRARTMPPAPQIRPAG